MNRNNLIVNLIYNPYSIYYHLTYGYQIDFFFLKPGQKKVCYNYKQKPTLSVLCLTEYKMNYFSY